MATLVQLVFLAVCISHVFGQACPPGWQDSGPVCSQFSVQLFKGWDAANTFCRDRGGTLASMRSNAHRDWLLREVARRGDIWWVGLNKQGSSSWRWVDGTGTDAISSIPWRRGYPDNRRGLDCVKLTSVGETGLVNTGCADNTGFICQRNKNAPWPCYPDWEYVSDTCYRSYRTRQTFTQASTTCTSQGAHLAWITNTNENRHVHDLGLTYDMDHWIGLMKTAQGWQWTNPAVRGVPFEAWAPGHPIDRTNTCTMANDQRNMPAARYWTTQECSERHFFLCRRSKDWRPPTTKATTPEPPPIITTAPSSEGCPSSAWVLRGDYCYLIRVEDLQRFSSAELDCMYEGGDLVSIHSDSDNSWLFNRLGGSPGNYPRVWIGLRRNRGTQSFDWSDGTNFSYNNWASGQPSWQDCVELASFDGRWYTEECDQTRGYVCKIRKGSVKRWKKKTKQSKKQQGKRKLITQ